VIIVFSVLLTVAAKAGFAGLPLGAILLSWFFKYAFVLFDHVARGVDDPPALDIEMVNPVNEQRPLALLAIVLLLYAGVTLSPATLPWALRLSIALVAALILPACVAVLGLERSIIKALNPAALIHLVLGLGVLYAAVLCLIVVYGAALSLLEELGIWLPVQLAIDMFAVLSLFSGLAGALYERRHELGLEVWHSPERTAELERAEQRKQSDAVVTEAYGHVRIGAHTKASQLLQDWLASREHSLEDYRWLYGCVSSWPDPRYANRLAEELVDRLLAAKRSSEALDTVARRLQLDSAFRPRTAAATLHIAQLAAHGGGVRSVARTLLKDFAQRFAGDPLVPAAADLARHLGE
jgi:hypothetical protein